MSFDFTNPGVWISLVTLCFLEIVLGIDNIIFISIVTGKLPLKQQPRIRNVGLLFAMVFRVCLLLCITWIIALKDPVLTIPNIFDKTKGAIPLSIKDLILIAGGLFLIVKSIKEIHEKMNEGLEDDDKEVNKAARSFSAIIVQIVLVDAVFSFDSILTAVGLVDNVLIMILAVIISMCIMMVYSGPVTRIINSQPTLQMLALSFLVVVGVVLIASGFHEEISKAVVYSALGFALFVEMLNIRFRKKSAVQKIGGKNEK